MKTPKKILDRRKSIRIAESLPFQIGHQGYDIQARTVNISASGVLCVVDQDIPMLTQLQIALSLPQSSNSPKNCVVEAKGVVVRKDKDPSSTKYHLAVYFSDIKAKDQKALAEYIQSRLTQEPR